VFWTCSVVQRESHQPDQVLRLLQMGDCDRFDERRELSYHLCSLRRSYEITALMRHTHDEPHGIAACIDCALHIRKTGCSAEFDAHQIFSVVMADRVFACSKADTSAAPGSGGRSAGLRR